MTSESMPVTNLTKMQDRIYTDEGIDFTDVTLEADEPYKSKNLIPGPSSIQTLDVKNSG